MLETWTHKKDNVLELLIWLKIQTYFTHWNLLQASLDIGHFHTRKIIKDKTVPLTQTNYHNYTYNNNETFLVCF